MGADTGNNNEDRDIDPRQGQYVPIKAYGEHKRAVSAVKVAPSALTKQNKILVASASADATVKIWDLGASSHYFAQGQATLPAKASHLFGINHYTVLTSTLPKNSEVAESTVEPFQSPSADEECPRVVPDLTLALICSCGINASHDRSKMRHHSWELHCPSMGCSIVWSSTGCSNIFPG
jgi:WD40 repeat protein